MEEILASIRRIIADDEAKPAVKPQEAAPAPAAVVEKPAPAPAPRPVAPPPPPRPAPVAEIKPVAPPTPPAPPPPGADVLDLTEAMAAPPPPTPAPSSFRTIDGQSDVVFADRAPDPASSPPEPAIRAVEEARKQFVPDRNLLSTTTANAVDSAFNSLAHTVLGNNARTLEDLVKEMLRPMLKSWLDDNLPGLVDRIVRAEIERVSRGH